MSLTVTGVPSNQIATGNSIYPFANATVTDTSSPTPQDGASFLWDSNDGGVSAPGWTVSYTYTGEGEPEPNLLEYESGGHDPTTLSDMLRSVQLTPASSSVDLSLEVSGSGGDANVQVSVDLAGPQISGVRDSWGLLMTSGSTRSPASVSATSLRLTQFSTRPPSRWITQAAGC
jgi:hypothetical protein